MTSPTSDLPSNHTLAAVRLMVPEGTESFPDPVRKDLATAYVSGLFTNKAGVPYREMSESPSRRREVVDALRTAGILDDVEMSSPNFAETASVSERTLS